MKTPAMIAKPPKMLLLGLSFLLLSGCWSRTEINDAGFVLAAAIDLTEDGQYRYSVQVPLAGQLGGATGGGGGSGGDKTYYIDSETGSTIIQATSKLQARMARKLFFGHRRVLIIGEDLAREGIRELFDVGSRFPENRLSAFMVVAQGEALDLLNTQPKLERFSGEAIRELAKTGIQVNINMRKMAQALSNPGIDPVALYMKPFELKTEDEPTNEVQIDGLAQFRDDKLVEILQEKETFGIMWLFNAVEPHTFTLNYKNSGPVELAVKRGQTIITPHIDDSGNVRFSVRTVVKMGIIENTTDVDFTMVGKLKELQTLAAQQVKEWMEAAIRAIQRNKADSVGFGMILYRSYPRQWKERFADDWNERLPDVEFNVTVEAFLEQAGLIDENVAKKVNV